MTVPGIPTQPSRPAPAAHGPASRRAGPAFPAGTGGRTVLAWAGAGGSLARCPRPNIAALGLAIDGPVPLPGEYPPHSFGFRYWAVAEALARAATLWRQAGAGGPAALLRVRLDGPARRPCFSRTALDLPAATPLDACRGIGIAVLDTLRPELWDIAAGDADALHHAFAAATAQLLGFAPSGSCGLAAVLPALVAALQARHGAGAAARAARLLVTAARRVPVAPGLLGQVATELATAAAVQEGPPLAARLRALLAAQGLIARSPVLEGFDPHEAEDGTEIPAAAHPLPWVAVAAPGLALPLLLRPASQPPRLAAIAPETAPAPLAEAWRHASRLLACGLAEAPRIGRARRSAAGTRRWATHLLVDDGRTLCLTRQRMMLA